MSYLSTRFQQAQVGNLIEKEAANNIEEQYETLAWHYNYSKNDAKAIEYSVKAGDKYASFSATVDAKKYYEIAINRINQQEPLSKKEKDFFVELCLKNGQYAHNDPSKELFEFMIIAIKYAEELKDKVKLCKLYYWLARMYLDKRETTKALELTKKCYKLAKNLKDPHMLGLANYIYGAYFFMIAKPKESSEYMFEAGKLLANTTDHQLARSAKSQYAVQNAMVEGDFNKSEKIFDEVIKMAREKKDESQVRVFIMLKGLLCYHFCRWEKLLDHLEKHDVIDNLQATVPKVYASSWKASALVGVGKIKEGTVASQSDT